MKTRVKITGQGPKTAYKMDDEGWIDGYVELGGDVCAIVVIKGDLYDIPIQDLKVTNDN